MKSKITTYLWICLLAVSEATMAQDKNIEHYFADHRAGSTKSYTQDKIIKPAQIKVWQDKVKQALKDRFDDVQDIGINVKGYNYLSVLTQYTDISDITSVQFFKVDTPNTKLDTITISKKEIAKLDISNISLLISIGK